MIDRNLLEKVRPWIETSLGYPLPETAADSPTLGATPVDVEVGLFFAVRIDDVVAVSARSEWHNDLRPILDNLHPDLLFSVTGSYELSRVTLPDGVAVWGPVPCFVANEETWKPVDDTRVVKLTQDQRDEIDWKVFWHSGGPDSIAHWGIYEAERLIALSSASDKGHNIYEIGVDATQGSQAKGLGSAVVSAAGNWILEQGATPFASAADWNIPSGRNLRNLGLQYTYSALISWKGEFMVPPQPIGQPLPGQQVYDKYPRWAMNKDILENPE
jgi:hypothetical protein